jgi:hypothetical protein
MRNDAANDAAADSQFSRKEEKETGVERRDSINGEQARFLLLSDSASSSAYQGFNDRLFFNERPTQNCCALRSQSYHTGKTPFLLYFSA